MTNVFHRSRYEYFKNLVSLLGMFDNRLMSLEKTNSAEQSTRYIEYVSVFRSKGKSFCVQTLRTEYF